MRDVTLCFLIKKKDDTISKICLAMKKRGFGEGRWNGVGGKCEKGETIIKALHREAKEEIDVDLISTQKIAELSFHFPHKPEWTQLVHVYFADKWAGKPTESEEMKPKWFSHDILPFDDMWPDDQFWLPQVLDGKLIKGKIVFGEGNKILKKNFKIVKIFSK